MVVRLRTAPAVVEVQLVAPDVPLTVQVRDPLGAPIFD